MLYLFFLVIFIYNTLKFIIFQKNGYYTHIVYFGIDFFKTLYYNMENIVGGNVVVYR